MQAGWTENCGALKIESHGPTGPFPFWRRYLMVSAKGPGVSVVIREQEGWLFIGGQGCRVVRNEKIPGTEALGRIPQYSCLGANQTTLSPIAP